VTSILFLFLLNKIHVNFQTYATLREVSARRNAKSWEGGRGQWIFLSSSGYVTSWIKSDVIVAAWPQALLKLLLTFFQVTM